MHQVLYACLSRGMDQHLALIQHCCGVPGQQEEPVDACQSILERLGPVKVEHHGVAAFSLPLLCEFGPAGR